MVWSKKAKAPEEEKTVEKPKMSVSAKPFIMGLMGPISKESERDEQGFDDLFADEGKSPKEEKKTPAEVV
jgi:hypothetical protein